MGLDSRNILITFLIPCIVRLIITPQFLNLTKWFKIFLKNHSQNVMEKLFPDSLLKNQNGTYLWISNLKFHIVYCYYMPNGRLSNYIETKLQATCSYLAKIFKTRSGTSLPVSFSAWFSNKNISFVMFY